MSFETLIHLWPIVLSVAVSALTAVAALGRRGVAGRLPFFRIVVAQTVILALYLGELMASSLGLKILFDTLQWIPYAVMVPQRIALAQEYTGRQFLSRFTLRSISALWLLLCLPILTDPWHGLLRGEARIAPGPYVPVLLYPFTWLDWALTAIALASYLLTIALLLAALPGRRASLRAQHLLLTVALAVPFVNAVLFLVGFRLFGQRDSAPLTYGVSNAVALWALARQRLFDISPVAHRAVVTGLTDAVLVVDPLDCVSDANPAAVALLAPREREGIVGLRVADVLADLPIVSALRERPSERAEVELGDPARFHEAVWTPLADEKGRRIGELLTLRDVTERRDRDERLREAATERQRASESAEAANRAKGVFLANMSHEIRTPLTAILGFAQILVRDRSLGAQQRQSVESIARSGEHLLGLLNDILEMSKIEAELVVAQPTTFDLHRLFEDVAQMFAARAAEKGIELSINGIASLPRVVHADENKLRQVLINIIGNAVKYTASGGVVVDARADMDQGRLWVDVTDTGPGISAAERPRLFAQFEQGAAGLRGGGTGLGLAISRALVRLMGGEVSIDEAVGRGSVFRFDVVIAPGAPGTEPAAPEREVERLAVGQPEVRALVVDDNEENRRIFRQLLEPVGFSVSEAADGVEAVAAFAATRPRVVLMDLRMPNMGGVDAIRAIRELPDGRSTCLIAVTASAFLSDREAVLAAGADEYVLKPFRDRDLFEAIRVHAHVEYAYLEREPRVPASARDLRPETVAAIIPAELRARLRDAIAASDLDEVLALLGEVEPLSPDVAAGLRARAEAFEYDRLTRLLGPPTPSLPPQRTPHP